MSSLLQQSSRMRNLALTIALFSCHLHMISGLPTGLDHGSAVITTSGRYIGHPAAQFANVTEYLGISYAQPPIGALRFAAPVVLSSNDLIQANKQPYDCPYVAQPWGSVPGQYWTHTDRIMAQESADGYNAMSEDCLKMDVWSPNNQVGLKPVMVFVYGGGFERGSVNNPAYQGALMAAKQDVIVVTFNFRTNIMGFSNAPGADTNVAIRDVRLAMEWLRDNVAAFGGNSSSITMFGQSQGAYFISYYAYAFYDDPIAHAFIQQSGSAFSPVTQSIEAKSEIWLNASRHVGCNETSNEAILSCMRTRSLSTVLEAWTTVPSTGFGSAPFGPVVDDELVFANYSDRIRSKKVANVPLLLGSNDNEAAFYVLRYAGTQKITLNQTAQNEIGFGLFTCPVAIEAALRAAGGINVYRYEYMGDWPNLRLYTGSRAYHTSETSMVFGTMKDISGESNTALQVTVSQYMQHAWVAFGRDPLKGLQHFGWPLYDPSKNTLIRLGHAYEMTASYVSPHSFDAICPKLGY